MDEEYGDPDKPEDWAALAKFSPFHNVKPTRSTRAMFFTSSTKTIASIPATRARWWRSCEALGHEPLYYENIEGGHGGAADIKQRAYVNALVYTFLATRLGLGSYAAPPANP